MRRINLIAALLLLILLGGCSTKKNTWTSRQYHNLTARFNVNFNANQSFKEASKKAEAIYPRSFDEILPVFAFAYPEAPNVTMSDLDQTVTKSEKLIAKHSITVKPKRKAAPSEAYRKFYNRKEFNNMVDDAYLLIGKSQMYSQKYNEAKATFENIITNYQDQNTVTEARVWLAVLAAQTESPQEAADQLERLEKRLEKDDEIIYSKKLRLTLNSVWADIYIKQGRYNEAIHQLEDAIGKARMRETKVRYRFILAQLYERIGNKTMARAYYEKITKMNIPYDVQFSALMNIANTMDLQTEGKELEARYKKMLANENNTEYFDQIYYALGNLAKTQGDTTNAIGYYKKSVGASMGNDIQKGLSSLALGSHYYSVEDYYPAYTGYRDAAELLTSHPRQRYADSMANILNVVGRNLAVVNREDSLRRIAKMNPTERQAYADAQAKEALQRQQAEQQSYQYSSGHGYQYNTQQMPGMKAQSAPTANRWYFYNTITVNQGSNDFKARWGRRKLEDSWRRKNKAVSAISDEEIEDELLADGELPEGGTPKKDIPVTSAEYYLQNVPLTKEAMEASNTRLERALYNLAAAYYNDIRNNEKALGAYLRLLREFPQNENLPAIYHSIYQLLLTEGRYAEAEEYKAKLVSEFPENRMALVAQNPNYLQELIVLEEEAEQKYAEALALYRNGSYSQALSIANSSLQSYKGLTVEPNFALLKVLSTSYNDNVEAYKEDLRGITKTYPNTSASAAARSILSVLEGGSTTSPTTASELPTPPTTTEGEKVEDIPVPPTVQEEITPDQDYRYVENAEHLVLVVVSKDLAVNQLAFSIALFNADRYLNQNYQLREEPDIDSNSKAVVISAFNNKTEAMGYYNAITSNPKTLEVEGQDIRCLVISKDNLERLKLKKSLDGYILFFRQYYLAEE
ncbi:MAG: tetratricopeptide repeat protein [Prevotellaceae bacterium]|jgi:tetratricopeptide (TPR) repeat protein|nr:tetratricopeptide repeat protein [Prevotellaceae bacterium]